ncbi:hypothetical protein EHV15_00915 [Paenibacillus oralis]|uniref:YitT family protein n=1 Tax=Paenibacillus oralis TaxID=2490856 RepID=A0A3P3TU85_9BACL|nr:hypothetical protein [Paenibacillus oralis]RRJ61692.1 hypothetical protein EHV15_00915 [Paenibacillus oralis]
MNRFKNFIISTLLSALGAAIIGLGEGIALSASWGSDPLGTLWEGLVNVFGITLGQANLLVQLILILVVFCVKREEIGIPTVLNPFIIGWVTDVTFPPFHELVISRTVQVGFLLSGLILIAVGAGICVSLSVKRDAYSAIAVLLAKMLKGSVGKARSLMDFTCLSFGFILGGKLLPGPIISIFMIGFFLALTVKICEKMKTYFKLEGME